MMAVGRSKARRASSPQGWLAPYDGMPLLGSRIATRGLQCDDDFGITARAETLQSSLNDIDDEATVEASSGSYPQARSASVNVKRIAESSSTTRAFSFGIFPLSSKINLCKRQSDHFANSPFDFG